jgi:tetratricopeptide (TPR) repeat protein
VGFVYGGAVLGVFLAFPCGLVADFPRDSTLLWVGLPMAAVCAGLLYAWMVRGTLPVWVPTVAAVVLLVNLLAAGGIGFPGVAQNWWLLLAIVLCLLDADRPLNSVPRVAAAGLVVIALLLVLAFLKTMYLPVLRCQTDINEGNFLVENQRFDQAEAAYARAAIADPYSAEPWMHLANLHQRLAIGSRDVSHIRQFDHAAEEALKRDRRSQTTFSQLGNLRLELYRELGDRGQLDRAIQAYRKWTQLYPNSNMAHAQLAWAYSIAGDDQSAAREARKALDLDKVNPHQEKKLSKRRVYDPANEPLQGENAEQLMGTLRTYDGKS